MSRVSLDQAAPDFSLPDFANNMMSDIPENEEILALGDEINARTGAGA